MFASYMHIAYIESKYMERRLIIFLMQYRTLRVMEIALRNRDLSREKKSRKRKMIVG